MEPRAQARDTALRKWQTPAAQCTRARGTVQDRRYYLHVDPQLEDVAGNTPLRPFDFDLKAPKLPEQKLRLEFKSIAN